LAAVVAALACGGRPLDTGGGSETTACAACTGSCADLVAPGLVGTVGCTPACALDTSACVPPASTYRSLTDPTLWDAFDVSTLNAGARGFRGGAFDGRYVYFAPQATNDGADGLVVSFDSQRPPEDARAWAAFDLTTVDARARGFCGAAFDGRYLYLVPLSDVSAPHGVVARCDTHVGFGSPQAWSTFDVAALNADAGGFTSSVFDGRYLYLVPGLTAPASALLTRYDTRGPFDAPSSWSAFSVSSIDPRAWGFWGAVFDGRYVYLVPYYNGQSDGVVARYDTRGPYESPASWSTFDIASLNAGARGFAGGAFDGRYVYFIPHDDNGADNGLVVRYDSTQALASRAAWTTFDLTTVDPEAKDFAGGVFDGRYLYLAPFENDFGASGVVARYDTQAPYNAVASWSVLDVGTLNAGAKGFMGAVSDGSYVYFVPSYSGYNYDGLVVRVLSKTPAWLPRGWNASFF
jgi:hypothetical protein